MLKINALMKIRNLKKRNKVQVIKCVLENVER